MASSEPLLRRHPALVYFALTFAMSWSGALLLVAPHLLRGEPVSKTTGLIVFPVMLLGPAISGIALTGLIDGREGLRSLLARMRPRREHARWYVALAVPPACILITLLFLRIGVSAAYRPNLFTIGALFGIPAGFLEEIGWMGYAFPKLRARYSVLTSAILLGLIWSTWHIPAIDFLGTATPHGNFWLSYFLAFTAAMTAMRVLIAWIYANTGSVWLCQMMHVSSTGSLVVFSPVSVSPSGEAFWYVAYAGLLWLLVLVLVKRTGRNLVLS